MEVNFIDQTAQVLFSDLLRRSDDFTDAKVKSIAETAFRRALFLFEVRKDFIKEQSAVKEKAVKVEKAVKIENDDDCSWEEFQPKETNTKDVEDEDEEENLPCVKISKGELRMKQVAGTRKSFGKVSHKDEEDAVPVVKKKRGRPVGSGKKVVV